MIGIVVAAHKEFGTEMIRAAEGIVGPIEGVAGVAFHYDDAPEAARARLLRAVESVDAGDGVLVLTDMFGGTPTNMALSLMRREKFEVVAGMSLPVLLKAVSARHEMQLAPLADHLKEYGARSIIVAHDFLCRRGAAGE